MTIFLINKTVNWLLINMKSYFKFEILNLWNNLHISYYKNTFKGILFSIYYNLIT